MKKMLILLIANLFFSLVFAQCGSCAESKTLLKTTKTWDDTEFQSLDIKNPEVTVLHIKIKKGESLPLHKHIMTNVAYVKKGKLTVTSESGKQITISQGECLSELINTYHYGTNKGKRTVELIVFYLGEKNTPLSVIEK